MKSSRRSMILLFALYSFSVNGERVGSSFGLRKPTKQEVIECNVQLAVGHTEEDPPHEILHCNLDQPDSLGNVLYEIQGLQDDEFLRIKNKVISGGHHRFEFPGATRSQGKPAQSNIFGGSPAMATTQSISVPKPMNGKFQAIEKEDGKYKNQKGHRSLYKLEGVSTVLAVRVVALDAETTWSANDCRAHTFGGYDDEGVLDDFNMKSQIDACSYGKLKFVEPENDPAYPDVVGGVVTVTLNETVSGLSHGTVLGLLRTATPLYAGPLENYDHVMYFMPPGVSFNGAAAFGYMPGRETWYLDDYALSTGIQLHELGHNLKLGHSGESGYGYGDSSCYMGYGGGDVSMCYNAAKNWYLGWYSEFHQEFNSLEETSRLFHLVGLSDYNQALSSSDSSTYTIVLRIETFEMQSLFLTYNRQKGVNDDVREFEDKVTVVRADSDGGQSWVEAGLAPGQRLSFAIVEASGMALEIVVCEVVDGSPDHAVVSVHSFGDTPLCTPQSPIPSWDSYNGGLQDGILAHYTFDNDFLDSSGNRYHAFEFGSPVFTDGAIAGQALSFDGIDDYLELPNIPQLDFGSSDFTLTFWYRVDGDQVGKPAIIGNKNWRHAANTGWVVSSNFGYGSNGDDLAINLSDGETRIDGSRALDVGSDRWHFIAVRVKRGDKMSLLRTSNGSYTLQEDSISDLNGSLSTNLKIRIGTSHEECGASFTKMDLDDLGIWNRALSAEEVELIWMSGRKNGFNLSHANDSPNSNMASKSLVLIAKYDFENNLLDSTSNNLGASSTGGGISYDTSVDGSFMNLNNINVQQETFVTLPSSSLLDFGEDKSFAISMWVRTSTDFSSGGTSIISNKDWWSGWNPGWTLGVGADGRLEWNAGNSTSRCDYDGHAGAINDGQWHHLVFSMTRGSNDLPPGTSLVALYFDRKIVYQRTCEVSSVSSDHPINIGTDGRGGIGWPRYYSGGIDQVIISSALDHSQVLSIFSQGRSKMTSFAPSMSPITASPTTSPTMRPTASPVTLSPTRGPDGPFFIRNPSSGKLITIDIDGGLCDAGTNIIPLQNEDKDWQKWILNNDKTIESVYCPGMVLGFVNMQCGYSVSVVLSPKSSCEEGLSWNLREDGVVVNSKCENFAIDIAYGSNIILWSIHGNNNQLWELVEAVAPPSSKPTHSPTAAPFTLTPTVPVTSAPSTSPTTLVPTTAPSQHPTTSPVTAAPTASPKGPFFLKNPSSGKVVTIDDGNCGLGANIVLWQNGNNNWQKWMINYDNTIESLHCPGMVISFDGSQCSDSASVVLSSRSIGGSDGQIWSLSQDSTDIIVNVKCSTKAIDISGGASNDGANLILWGIHRNYNQLWELVEATTTNSPTSIPSTSPTLPPSNSPVNAPTVPPTAPPVTDLPTTKPTKMPSLTTDPSSAPSFAPTVRTVTPTASPSTSPTLSPSNSSVSPSYSPTLRPTISTTASPTSLSAASPTTTPSNAPSTTPTASPHLTPSASPSISGTTGTATSTPSAMPTTTTPKPTRRGQLGGKATKVAKHLP